MIRTAKIRLARVLFFQTMHWRLPRQTPRWELLSMNCISSDEKGETYKVFLRIERKCLVSILSSSASYTLKHSTRKHALHSNCASVDVRIHSFTHQPHGPLRSLPLFALPFPLLRLLPSHLLTDTSYSSRVLNFSFSQQQHSKPPFRIKQSWLPTRTPSRL